MKKFDTLNIRFDKIFRSINVITRGSRPSNFNGLAHLHLPFGHNYCCQRCVLTAETNKFHELLKNWFLESVAEWNFYVVGQNKLEEWKHSDITINSFCVLRIRWIDGFRKRDNIWLSKSDMKNNQNISENNSSSQ